MTAATAPVAATWDDYQRNRDRMIRSLRGRVLDLGAGTGAGIPRVHPDATWMGLEPDRARRRALARAADARPGGAEILAGCAEDIPLPTGSVDAVVASHVLCSVDDPPRVLREIDRVLVPGGRLVLAEHVGAPRGTWLRRAQRAMAPLTRLVDHGCDPARDTERILAASTLEIQSVQRLWVPVLLGLRVPFLLAEARSPGASAR